MMRHTLAAVALIALAACSHATTSDTSNATSNATSTAATSENGQSTTITTDKGNVTFGKGFDASKLGAPAYPGAEAPGAGTMSVQGANGPSAMASFKTADSFDKVYAFYKRQLPPNSEKMKLDTGNTAIATFQFIASDGLQTVVQISGKPGETDILITHSPIGK